MSCTLARPDGAGLHVDRPEHRSEQLDRDPGDVHQRPRVVAFDRPGQQCRRPRRVERRDPTDPREVSGEDPHRREVDARGSTWKRSLRRRWTASTAVGLLSARAAAVGRTGRVDHRRCVGSGARRRCCWRSTARIVVAGHNDDGAGETIASVDAARVKASRCADISRRSDCDAMVQATIATSAGSTSSTTTPRCRCPGGSWRRAGRLGPDDRHEPGCRVLPAGPAAAPHRDGLRSIISTASVLGLIG